jgi:hypothetical protein
LDLGGGYNSGGSVLTAVRLASMITGQFKVKFFAQQIWNKKLTILQANDPSFKNRFDDKMDLRLIV